MDLDALNALYAAEMRAEGLTPVPDDLYGQMAELLDSLRDEADRLGRDTVLGEGIARRYSRAVVRASDIQRLRLDKVHIRAHERGMGRQSTEENMTPSERSYYRDMAEMTEAFIAHRMAGITGASG